MTRTRRDNNGGSKTEKKLLPKKLHYTVKEVADDRGFSESAVRAWHERGIVDFEQPGGPGGAFLIPHKAYLKLCGESTVE